MKIVALIPARAGSKRIPGKNIKPLAGKPLIQWTIDAAKESGIFSDVIVSTDDVGIADLAFIAGCTLHARLPEHATDDAPDILWVLDALCGQAHSDGRAAERCDADAFAILRPTSPFRTTRGIRKAWGMLQDFQADSLRAVERVSDHPGKMWMKRGKKLVPLLPYEQNGVPWHSMPTQSLPQVWKQNASLEMAWTNTATQTGTIAGTDIIALNTQGWEGFDINTPDDWDRAEAHAQTLLARVP